MSISNFEVVEPETSGEVGEYILDSIKYEAGRVCLMLMASSSQQQVPPPRECEVQFEIFRINNRPDEPGVKMTTWGRKEKDGNSIVVSVYENPDQRATARVVGELSDSEAQIDEHT